MTVLIENRSKRSVTNGNQCESEFKQPYNMEANCCLCRSIRNGIMSIVLECKTGCLFIRGCLNPVHVQAQRMIMGGGFGHVETCGDVEVFG
jgi:hypothetical protein